MLQEQRKILQLHTNGHYEIHVRKDSVVSVCVCVCVCVCVSVMCVWVWCVCVWFLEVLSTGKFLGGGGEVRVTTGTHQHNQLGILVYHLSHHAQARGYDKLKFFQETDIYWAPATTTSGLYTQLSEYKYREIPRHQIR